MVDEKPKQLFADIVQCEVMVTEELKNDPDALAAIRDQLARRNMEFIEQHYAGKPILKIQHRDLHYKTQGEDLGEFLGMPPIIAVLITDVWVQPVMQ